MSESTGTKAGEFTTPHGSPVYGPPPYHMVAVEILLVDVEVDSAAAAASIPPPLEMVQESPTTRAQFFVGDMLQLPHIGRFHEGGILIPAAYGEAQAAVTPYLWTSTDESMLVGREVYGMPKLLCDDTPLSHEGNEVEGRIRRRGIDLLRINFRFARRVEPSSLTPHTARLSVRHFPDPISPNDRSRQVIHVPLTNYVISEAWSGPATVTMEESVSSSAHSLRPLRIVNAYYLKGSWTLDRATRLD